MLAVTTAASASNAAKKIARIIWQRRVVVVAAFAWLLLATLVVGISLPFEATANVLLFNQNPRSDVDSIAQTDLPTIATSTVVLERVRRALHLATPLTDMKRKLKAKVPLVHSNILVISYRDSDPELAVLAANGVADELARYYREIATDRYDQNIRVLDAALAAQKRQLHAIDADLQVRARVGGFVPTDDKAMDGLATQLADIQTQRELASATLAGDAAALTKVYGDRKTQLAVARHEILQNDVLYGSLVAGASNDGAQLTRDRARYTSKHPEFPGLDEQVADEKAAVAAEAGRALSDANAFSASAATMTIEAHKAAALVDGDRAKVQALDQSIARLGGQLDGLPTVQMLRLERDAAQADYLALSSRRDAVFGDRAEALSIGSAVVINRATPDDPQFSLGSARLALLVAFLAALAVASAFLAEKLDGRLRDSESIESLYGSPLVATLNGTL